LRSVYTIATVRVFLTFLTASAPHRVHHLLENLPLTSRPLGDGVSPATHHDHGIHGHQHSQLTHHHGHSLGQTENGSKPDDSNVEPLHANTSKRDAHHDHAEQTNCVIQTAAQHAQFAPVECAEVTFLSYEFAHRRASQSVDFSCFDPSPFSQRAPPGA
jgi:hypothetical protein